MVSFIFAFLFMINAVQAGDDACKHDKDTFRCVKLEKVYDGDTITVSIPGTHPILGKKISVRVRHLDTPEIRGKQPCEKEAARTARKLVENQLKYAKTITLKNCDRDKYFRLLCDVEYDSKNLANMAILGWRWVLAREC